MMCDCGGDYKLESRVVNFNDPSNQNGVGEYIDYVAICEKCGHEGADDIAIELIAEKGLSNDELMI